MRPLIAAFFLFIFSLQIIPIKEIGRILSKGQLTEENTSAQDCTDDAPDLKLKKEGDPFHGTPQFELARVLHASKETTVLLHHHSVHLPAFHVPDVFTPPPNFS